MNGNTEGFVPNGSKNSIKLICADFFPPPKFDFYWGFLIFEIFYTSIDLLAPLYCECFLRSINKASTYTFISLCHAKTLTSGNK
jgi:hypothetical protein